MGPKDERPDTYLEWNENNGKLKLQDYALVKK